MERHRASTRNRFQSGKASTYINPFDELHPGDMVIICCRVSNRGRRHSLKAQLAWLRREVGKRGAIVIADYSYEGNGADPWWLARPAVLAKQNGAKLLAFSTSRFIRHPEYHSVKHPNLQASTIDLEELRFMTGGVPLVTFLHPDTPPGEERSHQTLLGLPVPPGSLVKRKAKFLPRVKRLHKAGQSVRQISDATGIPSATVQRWLTR